jgi:hypothetical protein
MRSMASVLGDVSGGNTRNEDIVIDPGLCASIHKITRSDGENLLTHRLIPKLEDNPLSAFCVHFIQYCLRSPL